MCVGQDMCGYALITIATKFQGFKTIKGLLLLMQYINLQLAEGLEHHWYSRTHKDGAATISNVLGYFPFGNSLLEGVVLANKSSHWE